MLKNEFDENGAQTIDFGLTSQKLGRSTAHLLVGAGIIVLLIGFWLTKPTQKITAEITVNQKVTYQTIIGWEATAQVGYPDFKDWDLYKENLMDMAAADGINRLRLEVQINNENIAPNAEGAVNDNGDPNVINWSGFQFGNNRALIGSKKIEAANMLRTRLAASGEPMPYIVLCYVDFASRNGLSFYHHNNPQEYAELIEAAFLTVHNSAGWVPDAVEMILEVDSGWNDLWTPEKVANCLLATQKRLAKRGWNPRFIIPSVTNCPNGANWYNRIKKVNPAVLAYVDELSYHRYGECTDRALENNRAAAAVDGNHLSMTEFLGATYEHLHKDLKANAVAWQQYTLAYDDKDNGAHYYRIDHSSHTVTISSRMKFLRQYFKYVRRGAVRMEAVTSDPTFDPVAFTNTNGNQVVIVKASGAGSFNIRGLKAGTYGVKYTTLNQYDVDTDPITIEEGQSLTARMPSSGVLTVYGGRNRRPRFSEAE